MRKSLLAVATISFIAVLFTAATAGGASSHRDTRGLGVKTYIPLPKKALENWSISFTRLSSAASHEVKVSPQLALNDLTAHLTMPAGSWVHSISLGGYVNTLDIVHDWIGTKSKSPKRVAMYIITIRGLAIRSDGPSQVSVINHEELFIVSATTGKVKGSFSYR
jgi:hypothetical protein